MNKMLKTYCENVARLEGKIRTVIKREVVGTVFPCHVYNTTNDTDYGIKWLTEEDMRQMRLASSDVDYIRIHDLEPRHEYKEVEVIEPDWRMVYDRLTDNEKDDIKKYGFTESDFKNLNLHVFS